MKPCCPSCGSVRVVAGSKVAACDNDKCPDYKVTRDRRLFNHEVQPDHTWPRAPTYHLSYGGRRVPALNGAE